MQEKIFDSVVIGGGTAGYTAAIRLSQLKRKTCLIEPSHLGGVCLNEGCIPSKALLHASKIFSSLKESAQIGIKCEKFSVDMGRIQEWKKNIVEGLRKGIETLLKENKVSIIRGFGKIVNEKTIVVAPELIIKTENVLIATGSRQISLKSIPLDGKQILSSSEILELTHIPSSICVVGGGYIGLELATVFQRLGTKITIIEMLDQILTGTDIDLARVLSMTFKKNGGEINTGCEVKEIIKENDFIRVIAVKNRSNSSICSRGSNNSNKNCEEFEVKSEKVLVTIGRQPVVECLADNYKEKIITKMDLFMWMIIYAQEYHGYLPQEM